MYAKMHIDGGKKARKDLTDLMITHILSIERTPPDYARVNHQHVMSCGSRAGGSFFLRHSERDASIEEISGKIKRMPCL